MEQEKTEKNLELWREFAKTASFKEVLDNYNDVYWKTAYSDGSQKAYYLQVFEILKPRMVLLEKVTLDEVFRHYHDNIRYVAEGVLAQEVSALPRLEVLTEPTFVCTPEGVLLGIQIAADLVVCPPINRGVEAGTCLELAKLNQRRLLDTEDQKRLAAVWNQVDEMLKSVLAPRIRRQAYWMLSEDRLLNTDEMTAIYPDTGVFWQDGANNWDSPAYFICKF